MWQVESSECVSKCAGITATTDLRDNKKIGEVVYTNMVKNLQGLAGCLAAGVCRCQRPVEADRNTRRAGGDRTHDRGIMSPLL